MSRAMYRLVALLLCVCTVLAAPQQDSKITYVKRQVDPAISQPDLQTPTRESRIEKLPLTVPSATVDEDKKDASNTDAEIEQPEKPTSSAPTYNYSDRIYSIKTKPKNNNRQTTEASVETINDTESDNLDIQPSESVQSDILAKSENTTLKYETDVTETEVATEKYEDLTIATVVDEETTKAPTARFLSKLSHFGKSSSGSFSQNLIATSGKRRFRSRCRCERIWNCTKLQISVPRCPEEYFLCCS